MKHRLSSAVSGVALTLCLAAQAAAHHPPEMERCRSVTISGQIEEVVWRFPHVALVVRSDEGERYSMTWVSPRALSLANIARDTLHVGDDVTVTAGTRDDVVEKPMLLAAITREADGWEWSQVPQGC